MKILNLTQHKATPEQLSAGVFEPSGKAEVQRLLTFETLPSPEEVRCRAEALAELAAAEGAAFAMIGGAPFLMPPLEEMLMGRGVAPLYAFSRRESAEEMLPDGNVKKVQIFRHAGFVPACRGGAQDAVAVSDHH